MAATEYGDVYVVWDDKHNIYFTSTRTNQNKFTPTVLLGEDKKLVSPPQLVAMESGDVYVVWVEKNNVTGNSNIEFISSNDSGKTFSAQKELRGGSTTISLSPQLAATEKGDVYVVWVDINNKTGDSNIKFIRSNDSGNTFSAEKELRGGKPVSFFPQLAVTEKGDVYVVWVDIDNKTGDSKIEFIRSNDSGMSFDDRKKLTGSKSVSFFPQLAATEKGDVYVVWVDKNNNTGDTDIIFRNSNDSGMSFDDRKKLRGSNSTLSFFPQLAATEKGDVYVVWVDKNNNTGDADIFFRNSNDSGKDFERSFRVNKDEDKLSNSSLPEVATTQKDSAYVVWLDNQIQFKEILAKDDVVGSQISLSNKSTTSLSPQITATKNGKLFVLWIENNSAIDTSLHFKRISENFFNRNS